MSLSDPFDDRLMADLAAAADGTLDPARQAEIEALAAADGEVADALERQRRAVALIRGASAEVHAPAALRARLAAQQARGPRGGAVDGASLARAGWLGVALAVAAVVLLAVVLAVVL